MQPLNISACLKQKETPVYGGTEDDDIDVYVLNIISWYAAYGLYLSQDQLMLNHTKGTTKKWLLQDYKSERRWSHIRFVTRSQEEDLVLSFFDCNQESKSLDTYIDEFQRLRSNNDVSEKYKMIIFKKGLRSNQLRELLKTQIHESLDEPFDAVRSFNPRDIPAENPTGSQNPYPGSNKKAGAFKNKSNELSKCSLSRWLEKRHTEDKRWMLHPELCPMEEESDSEQHQQRSHIITRLRQATTTKYGVSRPSIASTNAQNRVFDPGRKANYMYFQSGNGEKKLTPERYLIKTVRCERNTTSAAARAFFDEGADFVEFQRNSWSSRAE
ncbi:Retrotransposon gag protein [Phytophthora infestans]|uniref:Retrotransposon gag protein n=1 Tax=Phytophthora infestans TaxID=4787 RepID=A0A833T9C3_PHYIN|nr:Retrotransposon gag protein [Phytophthora infestans]